MTSTKNKKQKKNFFYAKFEKFLLHAGQKFRESLARRMVIYEHKTQQTTVKKVTQLE